MNTGKDCQIYVLNAFCTEPFCGNPATVCVLGPSAPPEDDDKWMQRVAAELSCKTETAFVRALGRSGDCDHWGIRWFSPASEVDLCGHATLAAAWALWDSGRVPGDVPAIVFHTKRSGVLAARRDPNSLTGTGIILDFPQLAVDQAPPPKALRAALNLGKSDGPVLFFGRTRGEQSDALVEIVEEATVRALKPDMMLLRAIAPRGVIVTSRVTSNALSNHDFVSRWFGPQLGIPEDPVTGSAHCALGPYWAAKLNKQDLTGCQCSERGGVVRVSLRSGRALLYGNVCPVMSGKLLV